MKAIGKKIWAIADGYIPNGSNGPAPQMESHETLSVLNCGDSHTDIEIMVYFKDRDPAGPYTFRVEAERTRHIRLSDLKNPEIIPRDTDYACMVYSTEPVIIQHTRLDSRQAENALFSTIAYSE